LRRNVSLELLGLNSRPSKKPPEVGSKISM
jgi:hypothetical protein